MQQHQPSENQLRREHSPQAISARLGSPARHSYLKDFVYGAIDGAVTTFAVVSGVAGAELSTGIIVILGLANLIGDGFSMAASNFLGTRAEQQLRERVRRIEEQHIDRYPEGEIEEVRQLLMKKGFEGDVLERAIDVITSDRNRWLDMMVAEEHGLPSNSASALRASLTTFCAFVVVGVIPLLAFIVAHFSSVRVQNPFLWSVATTAAAFATVGAIKARFVDQKWHWSALETLLVGGAAAGLAYAIGYMLKGISN